ncbi:hypothetical protein TNCV_2018201 [Trichonephila clavipes]|nr:hypothetical protein TNCV_2018201 [Trichonephila clavipes]
MNYGGGGNVPAWRADDVSEVFVTGSLATSKARVKYFYETEALTLFFLPPSSCLSRHFLAARDRGQRSILDSMEHEDRPPHGTQGRSFHLLTPPPSALPICRMDSGGWTVSY